MTKLAALMCHNIQEYIIRDTKFA